MGADFLLYAEPKCELTPERKALVMGMIRGMTRKEFREAAEQNQSLMELDLPPGKRFHVPDEALRLFEQSVDQYASWEKDCPRDLTWWVAETYPLYITGGLSWGESPTETADVIDVLQLVPNLWEKLAEWAREDYLHTAHGRGSVPREYAKIGAALVKAKGKRKKA